MRPRRVVGVSTWCAHRRSSVGRVSEEAAAHGPGGQLVPAAELELAQHRADVGLDGLDGDEELLRDLLVLVAARDEAHHLALARREAVELLVDLGDLTSRRAERVEDE